MKNELNSNHSQTILTELRGSILIVTINRPDARNAFDKATANQMADAMDMLEADSNIHLGIVTGANGVFSAGADLKGVERGEDGSTHRGGFGTFARPPGKPLIAAVEGYAVGGGFELSLSCDLIVASNEAKMGLPEVRHGVVAVGGGLFRLPLRMPYHLAMEMALTGAIHPARYFHEHGIVNRLVDAGQTLSSALELAEEVLRNGPLAVAASKQIMARAHEWTDEEAWTEQEPFAKKALDSDDAREGVRAFAEKRSPVWKGR